MPLQFFSGWIPDAALKAICWTLVHSLWQGALAAALAGCVILGTRKAAARWRYNLLGAVLLIFLAAAGITFTHQLSLNTDQPAGLSIVPVADDPGMEATAINSVTVLTEAGFIDTITAYLNTNAGLLVLIWAVFFLFHCIRIAIGLGGVSRLRHDRVSAAAEWQEKLNHLGSLLGIRQAVRLLQSQLVKVPVAIGVFKPVILVPLGLLAQLPPEQAETILLHELAHIRRKDYLANLLQCLAEAVFFFNPALLWISSLIRQEREACCDDMVVANTNRKGHYLEALVSFQEYSLNASGYAMAIGSKQHYLLNRVKRLLTRENKKLNSMEKTLLIAGLTAILAFGFIPRDAIAPVKGQKNIVQQEPVQPVSAVHQVPVRLQPAATALVVQPVKKEAKREIPAADTMPSPGTANYNSLTFPSVSSSVNADGATRTETTTVTDQQGKKYTITRLNDRITSLTIDDKKIPDNEIGNYASLVHRIDAAVHKNKQEKWEVKQKEWQEKQKEWKIKNKEWQKEKDKEVKERNREAAERKREAVERKKEAADRQKLKSREMQQKNREILQKRQVIERDRKVDSARRGQIDRNRQRVIENRRLQRVDSVHKVINLQRGDVTGNLRLDMRQEFDISSSQKISLRSKNASLNAESFQPSGTTTPLSPSKASQPKDGLKL